MTLPEGPKLFIIGDSFSAQRPGTENVDTWQRLVAEQLSLDCGETVHLVNSSLVGSSQDWCWGILQEWFWNKAIGPDDYLIVALTHPSRFWFLERLPELSNSNVIDLDRHVTKEEAEAIELFIKNIQRPQLDQILILNRLSYLAYMIGSQGLRRPLMIKCFEQDVYLADKFEELNWAKGTLFDDIQSHEFDLRKNHTDDVNDFWRGLDGRFNHMCLANHSRLAGKVAQALISDQELDLTQGFVKNIIPHAWEVDFDFQKKELDYELVQKNLASRTRWAPILPWKKRRGITSSHS
jgi:hypothetical protein